MTSPVGIGVVGAAGAFGRFIAEAIEEMGDARIVAVAGRNPERTERTVRELAQHTGGAQAGATVRPYTDHRALIADPAVELVIISTPPALHAAMGVDAARGGKAIFMEKPVATSVEQSRA